MYITGFEEFLEKATELVQHDPSKVRYTTKFRGQSGEVVVKVTNDKVCLKHRIKISRNLKNLDTLNAMFMRAVVGAK